MSKRSRVNSFNWKNMVSDSDKPFLHYITSTIRTSVFLEAKFMYHFAVVHPLSNAVWLYFTWRFDVIGNVFPNISGSTYRYQNPPKNWFPNIQGVFLACLSKKNVAMHSIRNEIKKENTFMKALFMSNSMTVSDRLSNFLKNWAANMPEGGESLNFIKCILVLF